MLDSNTSQSAALGDIDSGKSTVILCPTGTLRPSLRFLVSLLTVILHMALALGVGAAPQLPIQHYTPEQGLAGAVVRSIERTPDGKMWFGCWGRGISSFDGLHWTTYGLEAGLPSLDVRAIRMDARGGLWAGLANGIACRVGGRWIAQNTGIPNLDPAPVYFICPMADGSVWFGLSKDRVVAFLPKNSANLEERPVGRWVLMLDWAEPDTGYAIEAIHQSRDGTILVGTASRGILRWRDQRWFQEPGDEALPRVGSIVETADGVSYAGGDGGVWRRAPGDADWNLRAAGYVRSLSPLSDGRVGVASRYEIAFLGPRDQNPVQLMRDDEPIPMQKIRHFPELNETWVGTKLGAFRIGLGGWTHFSTSSEGVRLHGMCLYADETTPATTLDEKGVLLQFSENRWQAIGQLGHEVYTSIRRGREDTFWLTRSLLGSASVVQWSIAK